MLLCDSLVHQTITHFGVDQMEWVGFLLKNRKAVSGRIPYLVHLLLLVHH